MLIEMGIIAIMRAKSSEQLIEAAEAVRAGEINAIEVTMTTPGALAVIEKALAKFGKEFLFGAGSVLDPESARSAILAGAEFIVCPTFKFTEQACSDAWRASDDHQRLSPRLKEMYSSLQVMIYEVAA